MIEKITQQLAEQFAKLVEYHCYKFIEAKGLTLDEFIKNAHSVTQDGKIGETKYFYKDEEIFTITLEVNGNLVGHKVRPNYV